MAEIDPDVRRYLINSVPSVPYLEAALLLRSDPARTWDGAELAARLYVPAREAGDLLQALAAAGIAQPAGGVPAFRYTEEAGLRSLLDRVADTYARHLLVVTDLLHAKHDKRARQFADAFRLKKD
jgi:hypothetical protein